MPNLLDLGGGVLNKFRCLSNGLEPSQPWRELEQQHGELPFGVPQQQQSHQQQQQPRVSLGRSSTGRTGWYLLNRISACSEYSYWDFGQTPAAETKLVARRYPKRSMAKQARGNPKRSSDPDGEDSRRDRRGRRGVLGGEKRDLHRSRFQQLPWSTESVSLKITPKK